MCNTPGTRGGTGGCDQMLAVKRRKNENHISSSYAKIFGKQIFSLGRFHEVGQKQKTEREREKRERETESW